MSSYRRSALRGQIAALILVLLLAALGPFAMLHVRAAEPDTQSARAAVAWLRFQQLADGSFAAFGDTGDLGTAADAALAFAAAGVNPAEVISAEGNSVIDYLLANASTIAANPGVAAKVVLALNAAGLDPHDANGTDLLVAIESGFNPETGWYGQSFFGHALAILALDATATPIAEVAITAIYAAQGDDGSWGFTGSPDPGAGDSNTTAIVIQALVAVGGDRAAIERGLDYLENLQDDTGAIAYDAGVLASSGGDANSTALAIQAFVAAGDDPSQLPTGDLLAALLAFQQPSGAFEYQSTFPGDNLLATVQAIPAVLLEPFPIEPVPVRNSLDEAAKPAAPRDGCEYYEVTGHNICDAFVSFWEGSGGLAVFGYPLTEAFIERNPDTGQEYVVQYFERQRFELHSENVGTVYEVLLGRLGPQILELQGRDWLTFQQADPSAAHYVPETGHAIADVFWDYWSTQGLEYGDPGVSFRESVLLFGYPISEPMTETNPDGDTVSTQWFERARFEYHPEHDMVHIVLLGRLGAELVAHGLAQ